MSRERESLQTWYRSAMGRRVDELVEIRSRLEEGEEGAADAARKVGQALRGSGSTFGFPRVTEVARVLESSSDDGVLRRVDGLIAFLRDFTRDDGAEVEAPRIPGWLARAAEMPEMEEAAAEERDSGAGTVEETGSGALWRAVQNASGRSASELTEAVARRYDLKVAGPGEGSRAAQRLLPEVFVHETRVLPLSEDSETITCATSDPTDLQAEAEVKRLTGRRPVFAIAHPDAIQAILGGSQRAGSEEAPEAAATDSPSSVLHALVVDDDASSRLLIGSILEKRGFGTVEADDGLEALELLRGDAPVDLAVVDLNMPRMDGLELMWEIRGSEGFTDLPILVVTGERDEILEMQIMEEGADDYVRKPLDPRLFAARVDAALRRSRARREG